MYRSKRVSLFAGFFAFITFSLLFGLNCSPKSSLYFSDQASGGGADTRQGFDVLSCTPGAGANATDTRRLTRIELSNTLSDLFGATVFSELSAPLSRLPDDLIVNDVDRFENRYTRDHLDVIADIAFAAAQSATATDARMNALLTPNGSCTLATLTNACVQNFIRNFGLKAWRRPLSAAEETWALDAYNAGLNARDRFSALISALLIAPDFSYHWELGDGTGTNDEFNVSQFEVASRLSYKLWSTMPDANLFGLAAQGRLNDPAVLESTVTTMLASPRAQQKIREFFVFWLNTQNIPGLPDNANFVSGVDTTGLRSEMKRELDEYVDYIVFSRRGNYRELLTSRVSFARTAPLAQIYGHNLSANPGLADQQMAVGRKGLLLRAPFLISGTDYTHPIVRGVQLRKRILCDTLGAPSPDAFLAQTQIVDANAALTMNNRQRITAVTSAPNCMSCHAAINPIGFALESFDTLGRLRTTEVNYDASGARISEHALDLRVDDLKVDFVSGESVGSAEQLVDLIASSSKGSICMSRQIFRYYNVRSEASGGDACEVLDTNSGLAPAGGSILAGIKKQVLNRYLQAKKVKR
ncbi:MAG TPA: DUF1592 domain-containing protein [Bdellovibrionales bacterium]|nr:DUF1592 domain-containing protein [Bdellovibrionales bacterium]